jgi:hypothetical protein
MESKELTTDLHLEKMLQEDPLYLPPGIEPLGMIYRWGRYVVDGELDYHNISRLRHRGFKVVPPERHPELYSDSSVPETISRRGSVLMEIPEGRSQVYEAKLNAVNQVMANPKILSCGKTPDGKDNTLIPRDEEKAAIKAAAVLGTAIAMDRASYIKWLTTTPEEKTVN